MFIKCYYNIKLHIIIIYILDDRWIKKTIQRLYTDFFYYPLFSILLWEKSVIKNRKKNNIGNNFEFKKAGWKQVLLLLSPFILPSFFKRGMRKREWITSLLYICIPKVIHRNICIQSYSFSMASLIIKA